MMRRALALAMLMLLGVAGPALAINDPAEALADPAQEARAVAIGRTLRCLVCQNESIEDSRAGLAHDLRRIVREHVAAGESEAQITGWLVARYGDFVRLSPPFSAATLLLWGSPAIALAIGGACVVAMRRRRPEPAAPLDATEQRRLEALLRP